MAARKVVHNIRHSISDQMAFALGFRLELRTSFLRAIELAEIRSNPASLSLPWSHMQAVWDQINKSRHLGTPVPEAFSTKIQRKLASTMPPRPIVQLSFEETSEHFKKLFTDGIDVLNVLNYSDPQSLLVSHITKAYNIPFGPSSNSLPELRLDISGPKTSTPCLHSHPPAIFPFQGYGHSGQS